MTTTYSFQSEPVNRKKTNSYGEQIVMANTGLEMYNMTNKIISSNSVLLEVCVCGDIHLVKCESTTSSGFCLMELLNMYTMAHLYIHQKESEKYDKDEKDCDTICDKESDELQIYPIINYCDIDFKSIDLTNVWKSEFFADQNVLESISYNEETNTLSVGLND